MRINRVTVFEIGYNTFRIEMLGRVNCYLLYGAERGILIDCGFGLEPFKPLIDRLCPVPYDVCITHADGDHIGACYEWDKIWLHPADNDLARDMEHINFQRFTGFHTVPNPMLECEPEEDLSEFYHMGELKPFLLTVQDLPEFLPLYDCQIFELGGGRKVTALHIPGHTMGSMVFLDNITRILFSGDAISAASDLKNISAADGYRNMDHLLDEYGMLFDRIYPAHTGLGPGASGMNFSLPKSIIDDYKNVCRDISAGDVVIKEKQPAKEPNPDFANDIEELIYQMTGYKVDVNPDKKQSEGVEEIAHPYGNMLHFNFRPER